MVVFGQDSAIDSLTDAVIVASGLGTKQTYWQFCSQAHRGR